MELRCKIKNNFLAGWSGAGSAFFESSFLFSRRGSRFFKPQRRENMKPYSKIIQIQSVLDSENALTMIVLCEDGSVWYLWDTGKFELITEMDGSKYA